MNFSQYVKNNALVVPKDTKLDIRELVSFLQSNAHITKLSLENAGIGEEGAEALANLSNLAVLCLGGNKIGEKAQRP